MIYAFFLQFWSYGFLIQGLGVRQSLINSYKLVRSRPLDVLIFDFVFMVLIWVVSVPMSIFFVIAYVLLIFLSIMTLLVPFIGIVISLLVLLLFAMIFIIFMTLAQMVSLPVMYLFWKRIKG